MHEHSAGCFPGGEKDGECPLVAVARHVLAMANDAYLTGHPEWDEIVKDARLALADDDSIDVLCCDYKTCPHSCTEDDMCSACVGRGDCGEGRQR